MILIDKIAYASEIRDKSPFLKAGLAIGTLLLCISVRTVMFSILILLIMGYLTVRYSRVSLYNYINLLMIPFIFLILGSVAVAVDITSVHSEFFSIYIPVVDRYISVSMGSLIYTCKLISVSLSAVSCLYFLSLTTPIQDLTIVFMKIKVPWLIIELVILMYRFTFILADMAAAIMLSQELRLGNITFKRKIQSMGMMLSAVFVRAFQRAERMYTAMESRCYDGRLLGLTEYRKSSTSEITTVIIGLAVLAMAGVLSVMYGF